MKFESELFGYLNNFDPKNKDVDKFWPWITKILKFFGPTPHFDFNETKLLQKNAFFLHEKKTKFDKFRH